MADTQQKNISFLFVWTAVVVLLLACYISVCCDYPYYFIWDMDYVTTLDTVLIQSDLLPDHISHTGFGMYLPLFFTEKIAHFFGVTSILDLKDVSNSLNPLTGIAELTDFIRLHTPFLVIGIVVFLCTAVYLTSGISKWYLLSFLVFLGTQESLVYHSSMVRTELYSVFYFSAAILMLALSVKSISSAGKFMSLSVAGVLLGLCFLTKIQSLFYVASIPLLLPVFSILKNNHKQIPLFPLSKHSYLILTISLVNLVVFLLLAGVSSAIPIPRGVPTWASGFGTTPMVVIFFVAFLALFVWQLFLCAAKKTSGSTFRFLSCMNIIAGGFLLAFALHFLIYSDPAQSLLYLLFDFKMVFFRKFVELQPKSLSFYASNFLSYLYYNPILFIVSIILNLLLVLGYRLKFIQIAKGQLILCLLVAVFAFINVAVGTRFILRDVLWTEILLNFMNLCCFVILATRSSKHRLMLIRISGGLFIVLFFANCIHACNMPARIDANYNHYGWWEDREFVNIFGHNQPRYRAIMLKKYNANTARAAKDVAAEHKQIRRTVDFVFKNQTITHRNIGVVFEGFPVWTSDPDYKIVELSPEIRGTILVDNASIEPERKICFERDYVSRESEYLDKFRKSSSEKRIVVLPRRDLKIFLFAADDDVNGIANEEIIRTPFRITLERAGQLLEMQGLEIKNYCEISPDKIRQKFFLVISRI